MEEPLMRSVFIRSLVPFALAALLAACGGNPARPSPDTGATISGVVFGPALSVGGSAALAGQAATAGAGLTVSVAGTTLSATVDGSGGFLLNGVPPGDRELVFTAAGVNARVTLAVRDREEIKLRVMVDATSATIDAEQRLVSGKVEIEGKIATLDDPSNTMVVNGITIHVPAGVAIRHGDNPYTFPDLAEGDRVHVKGTQETDRVVAELVLLQNAAGQTIPDPEDEEEDDDPADKVELEGRIAALMPGGAERTLLVDGTTVSVPSRAEIRHGSTPVLFEDLEVGDRVHVRGQMSGTMLVAELVLLQDDNTSVPVNVKGAVTGITSGTCPAIQFVVQGWTVETNGSTDFRKSECSTIHAGTGVHVFGIVQQSGRVLATWVQVG
jgi:hypothetical protein